MIEENVAAKAIGSAAPAAKAAAPVAKAAVPVAKAAVPAAKAAAPVAKAAGAGTVLTAAKAVVLSPLFGVAALGGIIAYEWWKGAKDAREFALAEKADS